ncbi:ferredoxin [Streptomyces sp. NPDC020192]|uniref:ferredoxin n=1 Tax=Streptomyces sp. NPDC020192 TaxID=3365066 RepID=UPI0037AE8014
MDLTCCQGHAQCVFLVPEVFQPHGEEAPAVRPGRYRGSAGARTPNRGGVPGPRHPPR